MLAGALALVGCSSSGGGIPDATAEGELGYGTFRYECVGHADAVCGHDNGWSSFPTCVIHGSSFRVNFTAHDHQFDGLRVEAVSRDYLGNTLGDHRASLLGTAALVATDDDERVVDMLHLDIVPATGLSFLHEGDVPAGPLAMEEGETLLLQVVPTADCASVGGSLDVDIESSDTLLTSVSWEGNSLAVFGRNDGIVELTATSGTLSTTITIEISPAPDAPPPGPYRIPPMDTDDTSGATGTDGDTDTDGGGATDTDGDSDTDTDTDTDTDGGTE